MNPAEALRAGLPRVLGPDGLEGPLPEELGPADLLELLRALLAQRALDEVLGRLCAVGVLPRYPAAVGLEAAIFGPGWALNAQDWVFPALREHGIARLRGATLDELVAQCFGNRLDRGRGRQLPGHVAAPQQHFASASLPLATHLVHAAGAARAMKLGKRSAVAVAYLGAAATCTSDFHAACDLAGRERLPLVLVCVRNVGGACELCERTLAPTVGDRVRPYGLSVARVDGADVLGAYAVARDAVARARRGEGPAFIEAVAWRLDDPTALADAPAFAAWDPLARFERHGLAAGWFDGEQLAHARAKARADVDAAVAIMSVQGPPPRESLFDDVFAARPSSLEAQLTALRGV